MNRFSRCLLIPAILCAGLAVISLSGCDEEDKPKTDAEIKAFVAADPARARQLGEEMAQRGGKIGEAGRAILAACDDVRLTIQTQAPTAVPIVAPKLDVIDAQARSIIDQGAAVTGLQAQAEQLRQNIQALADERNALAKRAENERQGRIADKIAHDAEIERINGIFNSRIGWWLAGMAALGLLVGLGLIAMGVYRAEYRMAWGGAGLFVVCGAAAFVGSHIKPVGYVCIALIAAGVAWAVISWWLDVSRAKEAKAKADAERYQSYEKQDRDAQTHRRQLQEVVQLTEAVKGDQPLEKRDELFGTGGKLGQLGNYLTDDTWDQVDAIRSSKGFKKASRNLSPTSVLDTVKTSAPAPAPAVAPSAPA